MHGEDEFILKSSKETNFNLEESARWIGYSVQSYGHCIYWLDLQKVSIERNILFNGESKPPKAPLLSMESNRLSTPRKIKKGLDTGMYCI